MNFVTVIFEQSSIYVTLVPESGRCAVKSVESGAGFLYPEYAIVIPGASESYYLSFSEAFDITVTSYLL